MIEVIYEYSKIINPLCIFLAIFSKKFKEKFGLLMQME